jgi:hypothetical protein
VLSISTIIEDDIIVENNIVIDVAESRFEELIELCPNSLFKLNKSIPSQMRQLKIS